MTKCDDPPLKKKLNKILKELVASSFNQFMKAMPTYWFHSPQKIHFYSFMNLDL